MKLSFAENIALNKTAHYVSNLSTVRKDANDVVDGRKLYTDGKCLSTQDFLDLLIDFGEILSIHHIKTYIKEPSGYDYLGIYIPIFFTIPYFCLVLFLHVRMRTVSSAESKKINFLKKKMKACTDPVVGRG